MGTIGAVNYVVRGLKDMPGGKAWCCCRQLPQLFDSQGLNDRILESVAPADRRRERFAARFTGSIRAGCPTLALTAAEEARPGEKT